MAEQAFHDSDDPADLPLFTQVLSTRPGRVRSTFSMRSNNPVASREDLTEAVSPRGHLSGHEGAAGAGVSRRPVAGGASGWTGRWWRGCGRRRRSG